MLKTKILLIISLFIIWSTGSVIWYLCKIKGLCMDQHTEMKEQETSLASGNFIFSLGSDLPEINESTPFTIDSIAKIQMDTLWIKGFYAENENKDLGINRARNIRKHFEKNGFTKPIKISGGSIKTKISKQFPSLEFISIVIEKETADEDFAVEKLTDKIIIYFPVASADPETNKTLVDELKSFANSVIDKQQKVVITGHTDNSGSHEINEKYGQLRAEAIKNTLIHFGMNENNIQTFSKGEEVPIASNKNASGRRKNRRVELKILTNQ